MPPGAMTAIFSGNSDFEENPYDFNGKSEEFTEKPIISLDEEQKSGGGEERRIPKKRPQKPEEEDDDDDKNSGWPFAGGRNTFFPIIFGGGGGGGFKSRSSEDQGYYSPGSTAIANSFSTGKGGIATSHATSYGDPYLASFLRSFRGTKPQNNH